MRCFFVSAIFAFSVLANADSSPSQGDQLQFKAILEALLTKHKIQTNGRIQSIERVAEKSFAVQLLNEKDNCQRIAARLISKCADSETPAYEVDFPRLAPMPCK